MHFIAWVLFFALMYIGVVIGIRTKRLPREKRRGYLLKQFGLFAGVYVGLLVMLMWLERHMVFHPMPLPPNWRAPSDLELQEITLTAADGNRIHAFWCPKPGAKWTIHYSHGNAGNIAGRIDLVRTWQARLGASVLIYDYPGFGRSTGTPDEVGCYAAAEVTYQWLRNEQKIPPEQILLYGKSLGASMATEMAMRHPHRALLLMAAFTSIPDIAQDMFPFLPARWIARTQFDNAAKLARYRGNLLFAHGTEDRVIPYQHALKIDSIATEARWKKFLTFPNWGHGAPEALYYDEALEMLKATPNEPVLPAGK